MCYEALPAHHGGDENRIVLRVVRVAAAVDDDRAGRAADRAGHRMPRDAAAGLIHDVPHLDIRHEQQIRLPGHGVADRLVAGGLARERAVDRERPETTQPGIPRRATSRAVTVEGIFSDTVSTADKTATFGVSIPSACATGSVFSTIPICVSTSG